MIAGSIGGGDPNQDIEPGGDPPGGGDDCICPQIYDPVVCTHSGSGGTIIGSAPRSSPRYPVPDRRERVSINWFPGHMNRARREIAEAMRRTDVVLELLDARLPASSSNPILGELRGDRPCIRVLNRDDLADPRVTALWLAALGGAPGVRAVALCAKDRGRVRGLTKTCRRLVPGRGVAGKPIRAMVVGIPNVGKSTLINTLRGRAVAEVGHKPAVTRRRQAVQLDRFIVVADTPGVLWPKIDDPQTGLRLAASGAIGAKAMDELEVALFAVEFLARDYPDRLAERYGLDGEAGGARERLEAIGRRRGCLVRGGEVDLFKAAGLLLRELQTGKLGRISFESPEA